MINITPFSTILCDIDGSIVKHKETLECMLSGDLEALPGVLTTIELWLQNNCLIFLITARPESARIITEQQLQRIGIKYHQLIMGATNQQRFLINDTKPHMSITARAFTVERNVGLEEFSPPE